MPAAVLSWFWFSQWRSTVISVPFSPCRWLLTEAPCGTPLVAELSASGRRFRLSLYGSPDSSQRFGLLTAIPDLAQRPEDV